MSTTKDKATGQWLNILARLGVDAALLDNKHSACPACKEGDNRFRFDDVGGMGSHFCNQCGAGDGFDLARKFLELPDFKSTALYIDDVMGWSGQPIDPIIAKAAKAAKEKAALLKSKRDKEHQENQAKAAATAYKQWNEANQANPLHKYLQAKHIKAYDIKQSGDCLLVPVRIDGEITSLQRIKLNGGKFFAKDGAVDGGYHSIAGENIADTSRIVIVEGYGTGASIREAVGCHVAVAFNAGNLDKVALAIRLKLPDTTIIIAADNDQKKDVNKGHDCAIAAALAVGGIVSLVEGKQGVNVDWNDYHQQHGNEATAKAFDSCIEGATIPPTTNEARTTPDKKRGGVVGSREEQEDNNHKYKEVKGAEGEVNPLVSAVDRLAKLNSLEYDQVRAAEAEALGVRASTLDAEVKKARKESEKETELFPDIEPWDDVVDGGALLDGIANIFNQYAILPKYAPEVAALWIINTYVHNAAYNSPMILLTSPEKRCGKTTTLNLFQALVYKPLSAGNISAAAVYRAIDKWHPTLLIDEADTFLKTNEEMAGVINSGHTRPSAYVIRCDGDNNEPKRFSTWCPKVISGIGSQRDTLEDRSIIFPLRRKLPDEKVKRLRLDLESFEEVNRKCVRWAADNFTKCQYSSPSPIQELEDRANDNWLPLLAIADLCNWSEKARVAAVLIRGEIEQSESVDTLLLKDIQSIFKAQFAERLPSQKMCDLLAQIEDRPWSEWSKGKPITTNRLAGRLKGYGIHSTNIRMKDGTVPKGYKLDDFNDAFSRYCNPKRYTATLLSNQQKPDIQSATSEEDVAFHTAPEPLQNKDCSGVAFQTPPSTEGQGKAARENVAEEKNLSYP